MEVTGYFERQGILTRVISNCEADVFSPFMINSFQRSNLSTTGNNTLCSRPSWGGKLQISGKHVSVRGNLSEYRWDLMTCKRCRELATSIQRGLCVIGRCQNESTGIRGTTVVISNVFKVAVKIIRSSISRSLNTKKINSIYTSFLSCCLI